MISVSIGELRVDAIVEESLVPMPFSLLMPGGDPALIDAERHWLEPRFADLGKGLGFLSFHTYLLRTPRHTILVDTCVGNDKDRGGHAFFHGLRSGWLDNLRLAGVVNDTLLWQLVHFFCGGGGGGGDGQEFESARTRSLLDFVCNGSALDILTSANKLTF